MTGTFSTLTFNLAILVAFIAVVYIALRVAQSIFGTSTKKAAATEVAAKLVSYPTGSSAVLRRRFVRALTAQHVVMPSGKRLAFAHLTVRVAPEDLDRLDPEGDLERLGEDGAKLYAAHAQRAGWAVPRQVTVDVEVDEGLRSGWIPPARGAGRADSVAHEPQGEMVGWDVVAEAPRLVPPAPPVHPDPTGTRGFPALVPDLEDTSPTMNVVSALRLERGGNAVTVKDGAILGRLPESPVTFEESEVSYRHAAIRKLGMQWQVKDLGSTNGTTVDGQRIDDWETLQPGAVIKLAGVSVVAALNSAGTVHLRGVTSH